MEQMNGANYPTVFPRDHSLEQYHRIYISMTRNIIRPSLKNCACDKKMEGIASPEEDQITSLELDDLLVCSDRNLIM